MLPCLGGNPGAAVCRGVHWAWIEELGCPHERCKVLLVQDGAIGTSWELGATSLHITIMVCEMSPFSPDFPGHCKGTLSKTGRKHVFCLTVC